MAVKWLAMLGLVLSSAAPAAMRDGEVVPAAQDDPRGIPPGAVRTAVDIVLRNFTDHIAIQGYGTHQGWVQSAQANFAADMGQGPVRAGVDLSLYGAVKLDGGRGAGDIVRLRPDGSGQNDRGWLYPGRYVARLDVGTLALRYGLQSPSNPFIEPKDSRSLPPTFRAFTASMQPTDALFLEAGQVDAVNARGSTGLQPLASAYGGVAIPRLDYLGTQWAYAGNDKLFLYASQARDVWRQLYGSISASRMAAGGKWTLAAAMYLVREDGAANQGAIDTRARSLALAYQRGPSEWTLSVQRIGGDQFLDYVAQVNGPWLANGMAADYNGPRERSLQLRYTGDGNAVGLPGSQLILWGITGRSAAARDDAAATPLVNGKSVQGPHHEVGMKATYVFDAGAIKGASLALIALAHRGSAYYPEPDFREIRTTLNVPFKVH